jgi:hypothetical protein
MQTKTCERCQTTKLATDKYCGTNLRMKDRLKTYCLACSLAVLTQSFSPKVDA